MWNKAGPHILDQAFADQKTCRCKRRNKPGVPSPAQVVHSRACTLGNEFNGRHVASWLVPLFDMLNHAGKQTAFLLSDASEAEHNTRWGAFSALYIFHLRQATRLILLLVV